MLLCIEANWKGNARSTAITERPRGALCHAVKILSAALLPLRKVEFAISDRLWKGHRGSLQTTRCDGRCSHFLSSVCCLSSTIYYNLCDCLRHRNSFNFECDSRNYRLSDSSEATWCCFPIEVRELKRFQTAEMTFGVIQGHWSWCHLILDRPYDFLLEFRCASDSALLTIVRVYKYYIYLLTY